MRGEGKRVNGGSHISSVLIFHDISALLSANYLSFSVLRSSPFSTLECRSFVDSFRETRCTADEGLSIVVT